MRTLDGLKPGRSRGFTFLEMLIALTIFSLIATSLYGALHGGIKLWTEENLQIAENQNLRVFFDTFTHDLRNAVPFSKIEPEFLEDKLVFPAFVRVVEADKTHMEIAKVRYTLDSQKKALTRSQAAVKEGFNIDDLKAVRLLDHLERLTFSYTEGLSKVTGEYEWKDALDASDGWPRAVKIQAVWKNKNGEQESFEKSVLIPNKKSQPQ
jgi:prepilin-type N-terminal cleavage/methylation domain-containing protein